MRVTAGSKGYQNPNRAKNLLGNTVKFCELRHIVLFLKRTVVCLVYNTALQFEHDLIVTTLASLRVRHVLGGMQHEEMTAAVDDRYRA